MLSLDTETCRFGPGIAAPDLVCVSLFDGRYRDLYDKRDGLNYVSGLLAGNEKFVGQNIAYDLCVLGAADSSLLPNIFAALNNGKVYDTKLREQLLTIADGRFEEYRRTRQFGLAAMALRRFGITMEKGDVRTSFAKLRGIHVMEWPQEARTYAMDDAEATYRVWEAQESERQSLKFGDLLQDEHAQTRAAFALRLVTCRGLRTDPEAVGALKASLLVEKEQTDAKMRKLGVLRFDGSKDMKILQGLVTRAYGGNPPLTDTGKVQTSQIVLTQSGNPLLEEIAGGGRAAKFLSTYVPWLEQGMTIPINPDFETLVDTGRTSSREPNIQNFPRKGGLRECFIPRPGYVFVDVDYSTLELRTLAQACIDLVEQSSMADALNNGDDLHCKLAAQIVGEDYKMFLARYKTGDAQAKEMRTLAKAPNFGFPGGMGAEKFVTFAKASYNVDLTLEKAKALKEAWLSAWPEMPLYFDAVSSIVGDDGGGTICLPRSGRVRGGLWFTAACNTLFQGPAADGAKAALYETSWRCYTDPSSALYGSYPVAFVHDEILLESPKEKAEEAKDELIRVMIECMEYHTPSVMIEAEGKILERWGK